MQFSDPAHPTSEGAPKVHASMAQGQVCGERFIASKPGNNIGVHSGVMSVVADTRPRQPLKMWGWCLCTCCSEMALEVLQQKQWLLRLPGWCTGWVCCPPAGVVGLIPGWGAPDRFPHTAHGKRGGAAEWSKSDRERQICNVTHMWNLKKLTQMNFFTKQM